MSLTGYFKSESEKNDNFDYSASLKIVEKYKKHLSLPYGLMKFCGIGRIPWCSLVNARIM